MADIAFLLLIFFMVIVNEPDRTRLDLPDSRVRVGAAETAALVVLAPGADGAGLTFKYSDGVQQSREYAGLSAIRAEAAALLAREPARLFKIKADGSVSCADVGRTFDALSEAGARQILLITDAQRREGS